MNGGQIGLDNCVERFQVKSFDDFINKFCDMDFPWHRPKMRDFMFWQLFDENGNCMVDYILRVECLDNDLLDFCSILNIIPNFGRKVNDSIHDDYRIYYTDRLIDIVNQKCKKELNMFGYDFNGQRR